MTAPAAKTLHLDSNLSGGTAHAGASSRRRHPFVFGDGGLQMGDALLGVSIGLFPLRGLGVRERRCGVGDKNVRIPILPSSIASFVWLTASAK